MFNLMPRVHRAMVATPHYLASAVGSQILQQGGGAYDAAVAISAALGVVYPHMTGLGGDAFFLAYDAKTRRIEGYNGSGRAAAAATPAHFAALGADAIPYRGALAALTVPGMADAWWHAWRRGGKLAWAELLAPAIRYAEEGFPVSRNLRNWIVRDRDVLSADARMAAVYLPNGQVPREGERLVQSALAESLKLLQLEGRSAFYEGELMRELTRASERDGGLLREEDFRRHRGEWVAPISASYRGYDLYQMPPNSQGFAALLMMNMLEHTELAGIPRHSPAFYHLVTEVVKLAFAERDRYLTDPAFRQIPLEMLLSKPFAKRLFERISLQPPKAETFLSQAMGQDTAYAAVVDEEGNAVSFIQSLYFDFGAACMGGDTGIILQNRGSFFSLDPASPNVLEPRKRSFHTLMPGMVLKDGKPFLLVGTQGGEGQPQTTLSVLTGVLDYGLTIQEAIGLPRWVYGRTWGVSADTLKVEGRCGPEVAERLAAWGHRVEVLQDWDDATGQSQGILISPDGTISGAADPRGDGSAVGW
ncbi:gamma-glutamyltransferase [Cohnella nanjingensis]|uniref:Glutathione hydrolase proenzyme n=1 Tax=Cohnella nanjingensis TaxID=1387779 RepID=A0A7X0VJ01_9BACL|nr:gamma-glutamyltransferase [Cohnella nanjingensis]MBB6675476.1 gamma-glutamyltransferase [Cohnella nanjingensis]